MKVKRFTTDNPRRREKVKYSLLDLSQKDFETLCRALEAVKDTDTEAARMLETFGSLANVPAMEIDEKQFDELRAALGEAKL